MIRYYRAPLGWLEIQSQGPRLVSAGFVPVKPARGTLLKKRDRLFRELEGYFKGVRTKFSVKTLLRGTPFQKRVWKELQRVPYGRTVSYSRIAERIGKKKAVRAVANAIGQNPLAIFIPCHRVIGKDGSLTGYAFGLRKKSRLLKGEQK